MKKTESGWKVKELIVAALEKYVTPESKVEHNIKLPVVGKPNRRPRQCDVVITYGNEPRQFTAIVEVQDRSRRPDITMFHGWVRKMQEVGANQLICVSELGFPDSIIDEVKNTYGGSVVLMTLQEFDYIANPQEINMVNFFIATKPQVSIESSTVAELTVEQSDWDSSIDKGTFVEFNEQLDFHKKMFLNWS